MQKVYKQTGAGHGDRLAFYFFFAHDQVGDLTSRFDEIQRDIAALNQAGYRVLVETTARREDLIQALTNTDPALEGRLTRGFMWSGPAGEDGVLLGAGGNIVRPDGIDRWTISRALDTVVFAGCHNQDVATTWQRVTRGAKPFGWAGHTTEIYTPRQNPKVRVELSRYLETSLGLTPGSLQAQHQPRQTGRPAWGGDANVYQSAHGPGVHGRDKRPIAHLKAVVQGAAALLNTPLIHSPDDHLDYVELRMTAERVQAVWLSLGDHSMHFLRKDEPMLVLESDIGPLRGEIDLAHLLEQAQDLDLARIVVRTGSRKMLAVQAAVPAHTLTAELLASMIVECARTADWFEHKLFGYDKA